jgi:peptidoglycan/LPS O-acetylase OafA/YrhL
MSERVGVVSVQIFFVISGFVICRGLTREGSVRTDVSLWAFYVRRCLRILPPLAVSLQPSTCYRPLASCRPAPTPFRGL